MINVSQGILRAGMALLRGLPVRLDRFAEIPLQNLAFVIELAQAKLRRRIALPGRTLVELYRLGGVLIDREADPVLLRKLVLRIRIAVLRHFLKQTNILDLRRIRLLSLHGRWPGEGENRD
jgi:hypothetical protein